jgi:biofilm protein TabA
MVIDRIVNCGRYEALHANLGKAFAFIREFLVNPLPAGRYEIGGGDIFALVQAYETMPAGQKKWESHQKYMDVQFVASGMETMCWAPTGALDPSGDYNPDRDFQGYLENPSTALRITEGLFAILWPEDIHKPGCVLDAACPVVKIVVKVKL